MSMPNKLVGQNYVTPDLVAKVTGRAKYVEDYRVDGLLHARLLTSPLPHARARRIDTTRASALPGVRAILLPNEIPSPADLVTDLGAVIKADTRGEPALNAEPMYQGEPVLAVAAVDELTAVEAIELIDIDWEPLPFNVDPIDSLRPGRPTARAQGNVWARPVSVPGQPPSPPDIVMLKWEEKDFEDYGKGKLPTGKATDEWSYGDVEENFTKAALVLDETFSTSNNTHQTLETRSAMAYWQNGKLFLHCSTQSTVQTLMSVSRWLRLEPTDIVLISEYTGGGFGSKATGSIQSIIPALLSKKANMPVLMHVSREDEHYIGGYRPAMHGRVKAGFDKDGRLLAVDMFVICDNGPFEQQYDTIMTGRIASLLYQPVSMRWRGVAVLTNTPPRRPQSQPGGMQGVTLMEPVITKAARKLGIDQVAIRHLNAPVGKANIGPANARGERDYATSAFVREALDKGKALFRWDERIKQPKAQGDKIRGVGVALSSYISGTVGFDGLFIIKPDGKMYIQTGVGNLGTESYCDTQRVTAEMLGMRWENVVITWGNTGLGLPWSSVQGGSQTIHSMTRAAHAAATDGIQKCQQIAARVLGGKPDDYLLVNETVTRKGGAASLTLSQVAQKAIQFGGKYDGHELPSDINSFTKRSAGELAGQGLMGVARDNYPRDGDSYSYVAGFAEVEVDKETGKYELIDYLAVADVGTVIHPAALGGQILGRSTLGMGHALAQKTVYDQHYGVPLARRFYQNRPPTILDIPKNMAWAAVELPDPETPVGARGIGEPPVGAGCNAILNAITDAIGDGLFQRTPVGLDTIVASLEEGRPTQEPLTAHI
jgi:CO/xanthine dehydrogenase Mo-binding subunit